MTHFARVYVTVWKRHWHVVRVHNSSCDRAHDCRINMVAEWYLSGQFAQSEAFAGAPITHGAVGVLRSMVEACWELQ